MTDQELKDLVAGLAVSQAETSVQIKALQISQAETSVQIKALRASQAETDQILKKNAEADEISRQETRAELNSLARQVKQTNKQLGELGNRWGGYTEGLIYPSVEKVLLGKFRMDFVSPRARSRIAGHNLEVDVLGFANSELNTAFVVEIKSRAKDDDLEQLLNTLAEFPKAFPHHAGKKIYGLLAAVDIPDNVRQKALKLGIYVMRASAESFKMVVPAKFQPKNYG